MVLTDSLLDRMEQDGFAIVPAVYDSGQVTGMLQGMERALQSQPVEESICSGEGHVYAARNVLALWPAVADIWRQPPLPEVLSALLGPEFGLVRVLYFDKPPDQTWALPWHKDLTIAVREHRPASHHFRKPTRKAGVPHVEAPREVLERMLTARIHLDDNSEENGPLRVVPGSHRSGKEFHLGDTPPQSILARRGDVLLMRPLLVHGSNRSHPATRLHRRILHLEFASSGALADDYAWHDFLPAFNRTGP